MNEKLKELVENAPVKRKGFFRNFLIATDGVYTGFWSEGQENKYGNIILLGWDGETKRYCKISDNADSLVIFKGEVVNFDILAEYEAVRFWLHKAVYIDNTLNLSTLSIEGKL